MSVWDNVKTRAQAAEESVWDRVTRPLGNIAERGIQGGVKSYLETKGDARVSELVGTVKLVAFFAGGSLLLYLLSQSQGHK